jgi:hypothetical protein
MFLRGWSGFPYLTVCPGSFELFLKNWAIAALSIFPSAAAKNYIPKVFLIGIDFYPVYHQEDNRRYRSGAFVAIYKRMISNDMKKVSGGHSVNIGEIIRL